MPDSSPGVTRRLYGLLTPYRRVVGLGLLLLVGSVVAELYPPLVWIRVVDHGIAQRDWPFIARQLALLVLVFGVQQLLSAWRGVLLERAGQQLTLDLRLAVYRKLQGQSAEYFESQRTGDLIARVTGDVDTIQDVLVRGTDSVLANALRLVGVVGIFIALSPLLGVLTTLPMLGVGLLLWRYTGTVRPAYRAARTRLGDLTALITDRLSGMRVVQTHAREHAETARVEGLARELYGVQVQAVTLRNRSFPLARFVGNLGNVIMLGGGAWLIMAGQFTVGGLLAYRGYGRYFYGPLDDLVGIADLLQRAEASGRRVFEVLDAPVTIQERPDARVLPQPVRGELEFVGVTFGYDAARPVLDNVSFCVPAGQRVAILGESGAGKSTLLGLVTRLHDPQTGAVRLDGVDVRDLTLSSLRTNAVTMPQDTFLFHDTVRANVTYACPDAGLQQIRAALRAAHALDFVEALPEGLDTMVGERGVKLSGGQRQRLGIARILLADPAVLLLDEPTSAVDAESELQVTQALQAIMQGRTTLIVTHRLSLARGADRVLVVADGQIVEDGSPELLRSRNGAFAALERAAQHLEAAQPSPVT
ncbi:ABC transporter ATP-binding protein [Deinococcus cavernae]|uniref:ABC transporter ATP-binding protein n=1 Tax=Deinococcus cavernae TaxID=2320857 RepID=A0A418V7W5_9DEIO|nr:ABC transporter ATP-binding protein [Deinococcus cavernae]RJF72170.1 ABC transporter ATP-binding protein [Deinococcus cavernae]